MKYSTQAEVSTMIISVHSHPLKIAFPIDLALEGAELFLAVDLDKQAQTRLNGRSFRSAAAGTKSAFHQLVIDHHIRSYTSLVCVHNVYPHYT